MSMSATTLQSTTADRPFTVDRSLLIRRLREVLPAQALLFEEEDLRPYDCDGLTAFRQLPLLVALPEDEVQVQAILRICHELRAPVVARGAATGLSGGATPHPDGVLVALAKLKKIIRVDPVSRTAVVQPGVRNLAVSEAAAPYGLYYAPDPSSQIACTIGGNVAENSGGVHCLKYGLTVHNVLRVRGLSIEGEIVEFGSAALDAPGYDLLALLNGSEGLLALITEVTVKLTPKPELAQVVIASFADVRRAGDAVASIIAAGIIPAGLEMMDRKAIHAVEPYVNAGYDMDAEGILLCESDGTPEEVAEEIALADDPGQAAIGADDHQMARLALHHQAIGRRHAQIRRRGQRRPGHDLGHGRRPRALRPARGQGRVALAEHAQGMPLPIHHHQGAAARPPQQGHGRRHRGLRRG